MPPTQRCMRSRRALPRSFAPRSREWRNWPASTPAWSGWWRRCKSAAIGVDDASDAIRDYLDRLEADPKKLDDIESRLALIERLKRKYGGTSVTSSLDDVLLFLEDVRAKMEAIETAGDRKAKLEQELSQASAAYQERATALTAARKAAAEKLSKKVEAELDSLALESAVFRIQVEAAANWTANGADRVDFLIRRTPVKRRGRSTKLPRAGSFRASRSALKTSLDSSGRPSCAGPTACSGPWSSTRSIPASVEALRKRWAGA